MSFDFKGLTMLYTLFLTFKIVKFYNAYSMMDLRPKRGELKSVYKVKKGQCVGDLQGIQNNSKRLNLSPNTRRKLS